MIFNIGPLEFILILLVAIIVLGPERMVIGARSLGRWIYKLVRSPTWRAIMSTSQEIRDLPNKIVRESGLEESLKEVQSVSTDLHDEISQAVKDVNAEVSQAASAVSAEVSQAVKDVNAELKQSSQAANQAAASAVTEANQVIQAGTNESQVVPAESLAAGGAPVPTEASVPVDEEPQTEATALADTVEETSAPAQVEQIKLLETGDRDQATEPVEQPVLVMQEISTDEPVALSNNGHDGESSPEAPVLESAAIEIPETPPTPLVPRAGEPAQPEEEVSIKPPQSPGAHIIIE